MKNKNTIQTTEYRPAPNFDAIDHANALKGIAEALHWLMTEGAGTERHISTDTRTSLLGLIDIQQKLMRELHQWLVNIENLTTVRLPHTAEDFDQLHVSRQADRNAVREPRTVYSIQRH